MKKGIDPSGPVSFLGIDPELFFTFFVGLIIARTILVALDRFFAKTESLGILKDSEEAAEVFGKTIWGGLMFV
jgi:hypothetical protein